MSEQNKIKEKISEAKKVKDLIEKSGNNFHYRVVNFLRERDWEVLVSPYYSDNITNKPREIDIIAEKSFEVIDWSGRIIATLNIKFFIECKHIDKETVFWFDNKDKEKAIERIITDTPLEHPDTINNCHYLNNDEVAKLFNSAKGKNSSDNEVIYKAISQSLNSMICYKNAGSIIPKQKNRTVNIKQTIVNYPLILCNNFNEFYKVDLERSEGYSKINDNFQLEVNYAYLNEDKTSKNEYFLIDVIDFEKFDLFLKELEEKDVAIIKKYLDLIYVKNE